MQRKPKLSKKVSGRGLGDRSDSDESPGLDESIEKMLERIQRLRNKLDSIQAELEALENEFLQQQDTKTDL